MSAEDPVPRFFAFLQAFMGAMLGIVVSGNLIQIAFFWELTSLFSFLLIGYWHHNQSARDGARMALIVTGAGGVCLLVGLLLLGRMAGSYDVDAVLAARDAIQADPAYLLALILILIGAFTKSAQVPFHFWLPHRSEEHTSDPVTNAHLVCRLLLENKKNNCSYNICHYVTNSIINYYRLQH